MYIYNPDIHVSSVDFTSITSRYWNSLFHNLEENAAHVLQPKPFAQYQFSFHLVQITSGLAQAVWIQILSKVLHMTSAVGIKPQTSWYRVQRLYHSATLPKQTIVISKPQESYKQAGYLTLTNSGCSVISYVYLNVCMMLNDLPANLSSRLMAQMYI